MADERTVREEEQAARARSERVCKTDQRHIGVARVGTEQANGQRRDMRRVSGASRVMSSTAVRLVRVSVPDRCAISSLALPHMTVASRWYFSTICAVRSSSSSSLSFMSMLTHRSGKRRSTSSSRGGWRAVRSSTPRRDSSSLEGLQLNVAPGS